jgi:hypothetical protein
MESADYTAAYAAGCANGDCQMLRDTAERVIARSITDALVRYPMAT